jgi:hypothetical protein
MRPAPLIVPIVLLPIKDCRIFPKEEIINALFHLSSLLEDIA